MNFGDLIDMELPSAMTFKARAEMIKVMWDSGSFASEAEMLAFLEQTANINIVPPSKVKKADKKKEKAFEDAIYDEEGVGIF